MKFISPIVTESPMLMRNSRLPYASPSKSTPMKLVIVLIAVPSRCYPGGRPANRRSREGGNPVALSTLTSLDPGFRGDDATVADRAAVHLALSAVASLPRVLLIGKLVELDVVELVADLLDL